MNSSLEIMNYSNGEFWRRAMEAKKTMFESIDQLALDTLKIQDIIIQLRREAEELHVTPEHQNKLTAMRQQLSVVYTKLEEMQDFVLQCQRHAEHPIVIRPSNHDIWI